MINFVKNLVRQRSFHEIENIYDCRTCTFVRKMQPCCQFVNTLSSHTNHTNNAYFEFKEHVNC